jgi:hypothetical protein
MGHADQGIKPDTILRETSEINNGWDTPSLRAVGIA